MVNGSPNDWTVTSSPSYQMDQWEWPTVKANTAERVYVEWGTKGSQKDDAGEAFYKIGDNGGEFARGAPSVSTPGAAGKVGVWVGMGAEPSAGAGPAG